MKDITWRLSESADNENPDQEADLCETGNPGGAVWASVTREPGGSWPWAIYAFWLWDDIDAYYPGSVLAKGETTAEEESKKAVAEWISARADSRP